jgi:hypothetical protein
MKLDDVRMISRLQIRDLIYQKLRSLDVLLSDALDRVLSDMLS